MFKAIGRFFRALGYLFTGRIDKFTSTLRSNPAVMAATFDGIISDKKNRINAYKDAIATMMSQQENRKNKLEQLTSEVQKLERLKAGAIAAAKKIVAQHGDTAAAQSDPSYAKHQSAYKDFSSTLSEKEQRVIELENQINQSNDLVNNHKRQIEGLLRDLETVKNEKSETIADVISSKEQQKINDMLTGISEDRTGEELGRMREMRNKAKANAQISSEISGLDAKKQESDYLDTLEGEAANDEFAAALGISDTPARVKATANVAETQLPE